MFLSHSVKTQNLLLPLAMLVVLAGILDACQAQSGIFSVFQKSDEADDPIRWLSNSDEAIAYARQARRPILAYVTSDHCGYCRKMERESWSNPAIANEVTKGFIPLRLQANEHAAQVKALRVKAFPTTLLLTPEGEVITGSAGFMPPAKLTDLLANRSAVAAQLSSNMSTATH